MRWLVWLLALPFLALGALLLVLALTPPLVHPRRFEAPPAPPLTGPLAPNDGLARCEIVAVDRVPHPEEFALDPEGRLYTGTSAGEILRLTFDGPGEPEIEVFARPGGRPNGLAFDADGHLLVSDDYDVPGSRIDPQGRVERIPWLKGQAATVARDGRVFFPSEEASFARSGNITYDVMLRLAAMDPSGRLHVRDPVTGQVDTLVEGLLWPDGVALSADEDFVAVVELSAYRITRHWLRGPRAGTSDRLIENLPGMPDGFVSDGAGTFYVSLGLLRNDLLDWLHRRPALRGRLSNLLRFPGMAERIAASPPGSERGYGLVLALDEQGRVLRSFHAPGLPIGPAINAAEPHDGHLYLASLGGHGIARCPLP